MLDFVFIILIFLEIAILYFAIIKISEFEKKIISLNEVLIEKGKIINDLHKKIQETTRKINFFLSILTSKKLQRIKNIISVLIGAIELIIIFRSFNYKKGVKFNLKNLKKLLFTGLSKELLKKLLEFSVVTC